MVIRLELINGGSTIMNDLQYRYLRHGLTIWVIFGIVYFCFWWTIPIGLCYAIAAALTLMYGLWLFGIANNGGSK
jgi:hypothetical protein